ncbi:septum formation family protein [Dactylosporangium sp. CA-092794]|uniref:septum formation family protein n=1 Tax=Dactylosporangium sp. CA-092794 TaxID=3239929 RepID=UPI003D907B2D
MRRIALLACAVVALGAGGCAARPAGADGDLTNGWTMLAAAKVPEPAAGECHDSAGYADYDTSAWEMPGPAAPCDGPHQIEVVSVGQVPAELAKADKRPERPAFASLYPACERAAADYLGGDWQSGSTYLYVQPPTYAQWRGGARFYHCDVAVIAADNFTVTRYDKPFKDAVRPGGPLALGCANGTGGDQDTLFRAAEPVACTAPHDLEFAGSITAPAAAVFPESEKAADAVFGTACDAKLLSYLGMTRAAYARQRDVSSVWWRTSTKTGWDAGEHSARCYFYVEHRKVSRSVKGNGNATI